MRNAKIFCLCCSRRYFPAAAIPQGMGKDMKQGGEAIEARRRNNTWKNLLY